MTADKTDEYDMRPSNREIVQVSLGRFEARDKGAADNWEPSEEMLRIAGLRMSHAESLRPFSHYQLAELALKAVRDLIIAEARPQIEAAERKRLFVTERKAMWKTDVDEYIKLVEAAERERVLNVIKEKLNSTDDSDYWAGLNSAIVSIEDYIKDSKP